MRFGVFIGILLLGIGFLVPLRAQPVEAVSTPVTRREVRRWLNITQDNPVLSEEANHDLIAEIQKRGVNFVLAPEEEWAFQLLEASDELILAIRNAIPADQRAAFLLAADRTKLYNTFSVNYRRPDLASRRTALEAGQEFLERYRNDAAVKDAVSFLTRYIPQLTRSVQMMERTTRLRRGKN